MRIDKHRVHIDELKAQGYVTNKYMHSVVKMYCPTCGEMKFHSSMKREDEYTYVAVCDTCHYHNPKKGDSDAG